MALVTAACGDDDDDDDATASPGVTRTATTSASPTGAATPGTSPSPGGTEFPADSTMAEIVQRGSLVVGIKFDQPGFGLVDPATGEVDGFDVAIAKEIAAELGLEEDQVEFTEAISANRIPFLQEDKVDIVVATMTINDDRKQQIDFSRPYYLAGQSILVMADNDTISSVDDLNGKNVCSVQGSTSEANVMREAPDAELLALTGYAACVDAMKTGRVEAVSTDDIILAGFAAADPSLKLVGGQFTEEPYGIGIKQGKDDFVEFIDGVINEMMEDGRWEAIYDEYLGGVEGLPDAAEALENVPDEA
jgi:glutamate transport system substrate-binding protein